MRLNTRTAGRWYKRIGVATNIDKSTTYLCSTTRHTTNHVLHLSTSYDKPETGIKMYKMVYPQVNWNSYRALLTCDSNGDGRTIATQLQYEKAIIVGDGSYDIKNDEGSAAVIMETSTSRNRIANA